MHLLHSVPIPHSYVKSLSSAHCSAFLPVRDSHRPTQDGSEKSTFSVMLNKSQHLSDLALYSKLSHTV